MRLSPAAADPSRPLQAEGSPAPAPAVASAVNDGRKVEIVANDTMKFSIVEIHAKPGERLSVTLVNKGLTPKFSMGHNWILIKPEVNVDAFLATAAESPTTEYVPAASRGQILASTKLLGPGEQDTATFAAPATARPAIRSSVRTRATRRSACAAC